MARAVAAVPAFAFLITVEVLARAGRARTADVAPILPEDDADEPVADPWQYATPIGPQRAPEPVKTARVKPRSLTAAERVTAAHDKQPTATHERIATLAKVSLSTVKRYRPTGSPSEPLPAETRLNGNRPDLEFEEVTQ